MDFTDRPGHNRNGLGTGRSWTGIYLSLIHIFAGNGGSAADAEHIVGELMKGFVKRRPVTEEMKEALEKADPVRGKELSEKLQGGLPAIALVDQMCIRDRSRRRLSALPHRITAAR